MPSIMFIASGCKSVSSFIAEHAGTPCHGKAAFSATHALKPCSMFGASVAMRHATGRGADAQSGCLSFGSLLTQQQRQNATRHRHVAGRPAAASDLAGARARSTNMQHAARARWQHASCKAAVSAMVCRPRPKSLAAVQNVAIQIQGSVAMHRPNINSHGQFGLFSPAFASATSLTGQSSGHQRAAHAGAAYLGRYAPACLMQRASPPSRPARLNLAGAKS